ncbi:MAG: DNA alkylation repair enzyme [Alistipes sp.]|nr:DNA alkylation repair enzyme [Alistipes sp.]
MQNNTSKMVALLGKIRKQMNGAVLDTFRYYGAKYGMNYGVAIHSLRDMAREVGTDEELSQFLLCQQVRELQIIALWIADSRAVTIESLDGWRSKIINSEIAEQAAQALFSRIDVIDALLDSWCNTDNELLAYAALLAASRNDRVSIEAISRAVQNTATRFADNHLAAQGISRLLGAKIAQNRAMVVEVISALPANKTAESVREEIAWQLEC